MADLSDIGKLATLLQKPDMRIEADMTEIERLRAGWLDQAARDSTEIVRLEQRIEALEAALNRYRYAVQWAAADSWDHCGDCRARLEWAKASDRRLDANEMAAVGQQFHAAY